MTPSDRFDRPLRDLRVSVTDRCNFRCVYCMPKAVFDSSYKFLPKKELLSFEEIVSVVRAGARLGVSKVRLTGGEPLVRRDLEELVTQIRGVEGISDISMTTNASLLSRERARSLRDAGLQRLNVSLDAMDDETFKAVNDVGVSVQAVLAQANYRGEVAKRWEYLDGGGEIGIISSVSEPFCGDCSRARLSATGSIYTCLFASSGHDLRPVLRSGNPDDVQAFLHKLWSKRGDRYSETRTQVSVIRPKVEMSFIGG